MMALVLFETAFDLLDHRLQITDHHRSGTASPRAHSLMRAARPSGLRQTWSHRLVIIHSPIGLDARSRSRATHPIGTMGYPTLSRSLKGLKDDATHHRSTHGLHRAGSRRADIRRAINMSTEPTTRTMTLTGRLLVPSIQPDWPLIGSAAAPSPDSLDAGPGPSACNQDVRCVLGLLLA
jgi:hypothetical protein